MEINKLFVYDLLDSLSLGYEYNITSYSQEYVKELLYFREHTFPMLCCEYTTDSDSQVSVDESKFLNDSSHEGLWIIGAEYDDIVFAINLKSYGDTLEIDAIEVNYNRRKEGIGDSVVTAIEQCAKEYYNKIKLSPFDTDALNFWKYMEYNEDFDGSLFKELNV